uniref:RNase H type-1 domain-containing protein n=1 Tax=Tanacetum cinerariifolium TaxID=118510 RepID=A0A6L2N1C0_TANCI|nr:hypothetical protein [Tanacetum cinerariifolium]
MDRHVSDAALREYCDRNYHKLLPIIAEKVHHEKVQQEKLKAVKARLNSRSVSRSHEPRRGRPETPWKRDPERKMVFKRLEKVADILRVVTRAPTREEKSLPLRNSITKEYPHKRLKLYQKAKVAQEDTGSQGQKSKGQALRMTNYPNHGYARKLILSLPTFVILISQKAPACQVTPKHMTEARIQKITSRSSRQWKKWNVGFKVESQDVKGASKITRILVFMHGITNPKLIRRLHDEIPKSVDEMMRITTSFLGGRWQVVTKNERSHFRHGNNRRSEISRISRKEVLKISKGQSGDKIGGVLTLRSSKIIPIECATVSRPEGQPPVAHQAIKERIKVAINPYDPEQTIMIGSTLTEEGRNKLFEYTRRMPSSQEKKRSQAVDRNQTIQEEVEKLIGAGIMKEVHYHSWLSNPIMGYHQIKMAKEDEEKTSFITSQGVFCYSKMPFGLKNARATYQRLVDKAFHKQIGRNLETKEAEAAFKQMKHLIAKLPTLTAPEEKEELIVYLAAAKEAVSAVLMSEREAKQMLIYFVIHALRGPKVNYTSMEKLVLELSIELGEYAIHYRPRVSVKGKILADFIVERPEEDDTDTAMEVEKELLKLWILFTDGSSCADGSRARLILINSEGAEFTYALRFRFEATNSEAEYKALIVGLRIEKEIGVKNLQANVDSRLVANQVNGTYIAKEEDMIRYLEKLMTLTNDFRMFSIKQVPNSENKKVNTLSKIASTSFAHPSKQVLVEELKEKLINEFEVLTVVEEEGKTWMTSIYEYLTEETLPAEVNKARAMRRKSQRFAVINGVLHEIRSGAGYYWPTMHKDARALIRACQDCQSKPKLRGRNQDKARRKNQELEEEMSQVLRAHRTMIKSSNEDTSFSLKYGTEAVIPAEIGMPMLRTSKVDMVQNNEALEINLDLLEKRREQAAIREAKSKEKMEKYYKSKVHCTSFKPGDLVYHRNDASHTEEVGKLGPKWETK